MKKQTLNWNEYFNLCDGLINQISDFKFTDIIAFSRGGLIPAQYIAYKLDIKRIHNYGISTYSNDNIQLNDNAINIYQKILFDFNNFHKILVIDDIADTGRTMQLFFSLEHNIISKASDIVFATLHYKKGKSLFEPHYFAQAVYDDVWIEYPYD